MSFSLYLKNKISKNKINRSDLIAQLNLYHKEFNNLDAITFSRWITNKTTPSPYKQILISNYFNDDLMIFIKNHITIKKESKVTITIFNKIMSKIESSYCNISYFYSNEEETYIIETLEHDIYQSIFNKYYMNFKTYRDLYKAFKIENIEHSHTCIIKRKNSVISSHLSLTKLSNKKSCLLSSYFGKNISGDYFIDLGYIEDRNSYLFMVSLLLDFLYKKSARYLVCLIRSELLELFLSLSFEQIGTKLVDDNLYIVEIDFLKLMSNPFIINLLKQN